VDWDYKGPLAMMQQRGQYEAVAKLVDLTERCIGIDENAKYVVMVNEGLRAVAEALGVPAGVIASREDYDAKVAKLEQAQQDAHEMELVQGAATSLRDGGQGISSLAGAGPGGGQGGRPMEQAA
jgi:preprotein translocase subunit SecA